MACWGMRKPKAAPNPKAAPKMHDRFYMEAPTWDWQAIHPDGTKVTYKTTGKIVVEHPSGAEEILDSEPNPP
jgi:hypothetical protein